MHLHPGIAIVGGHDVVRHHFDVALHDFVGEFAADQAFYRKQCIGRIGDGLALGRLTDEDFTIFCVGYNRRCGARAFGIFDNARLAAFHHCNAGVGGAQVNANYFTHVLISPDNLILYLSLSKECVCLNKWGFLTQFQGRHPHLFSRYYYGALATTTMAGRTTRSFNE